jgi:hypothetical protein
VGPILAHCRHAEFDGLWAERERSGSVFFVFALVCLALFSVALCAAAFLLRDAYRRRRLVLIAPIVFLVPFIVAFPAEWIAGAIPAADSYWGGANPMAAMAAWPALTAIGYGLLWKIAPPEWRDGD